MPLFNVLETLTSEVLRFAETDVSCVATVSIALLRSPDTLTKVLFIAPEVAVTKLLRFDETLTNDAFKPLDTLIRFELIVPDVAVSA